jgi:hypothetical protein
MHGLQKVGQTGATAQNSEEFADMFLGWVFNRWETKGNGDFTDAGKARSKRMDQHMRAWITK